MPEEILHEVDGRVATVTLNAPERLNAISRRMQQELVAALEDAERDHGVHVAVVQGAGRAFSTGFHLGAQREDDGRPYSPTSDRD